MFKLQAHVAYVRSWSLERKREIGLGMSRLHEGVGVICMRCGSWAKLSSAGRGLRIRCPGVPTKKGKDNIILVKADALGKVTAPHVVLGSWLGSASVPPLSLTS